MERTLNIGEGALLATACAAVAAVPAALRVSGSSMPLAWLGLAGSAALLLGPLVILSRAARPWPKGLYALPAGAIIALGPLMLFASVLKETTNHRPLGAATFAVVSAGVLLGAIALAARLLSWARSEGLARALARGSIAVLVLASAALTALHLLPAFGALGQTSGVRGQLLDVVVAVVAVSAATRLHLPDVLGKAAKRSGFVVLLVLSVTGLAVLRMNPELVESARSSAPLVLGMGSFVGG